jgi:serine/threonine-protein kinase
MDPSEPDDVVIDQLLAAAFGPGTRPPKPDSPPVAAVVEISSRYRLAGEIGRGGVGIVLRGRDVELNRDVAIKILRPEHREHAGLTRRFVEEAQIGGQLEHPGIVPVHEMGTTPDGRPYFAMKLIQGRTLAEILKARRSAADERDRWLSIFEQVCQTIAYAHARGVIHRDLKPANVILGAFGEVQVADWGLAKVVGRAEPTGGGPSTRVPSGESAVSTTRTSSSELLSQAGSVLGTLSYMPPEQARGESDLVDARSDVFALGAMLCEVLTGTPPYTGESNEILEQARSAQLGPALSRLALCGAEPELVELAKRCLAEERDDRPRDAAELADAIARHRAAVHERARAAELAATAAQARAAEERRARRLTLALAATGVLVLAIGGGAYLKNERDRRDRQEQAARPVRDALGRARELVKTAATAPPDAVEPWRAALGAADGAVAAANAGDPGPALRDEAGSLHAEIAREVARAEAAAKTRVDDEQALHRIGRLAGKIGVWAWDELDLAFEQAFRDWGLDFATMTDEQAIARLRASSDPVSFCDFLLSWMGVQASVAGNNQPPRYFLRMMPVIQTADPDPWRVRIRQAIPYDVKDLVEMTRDPQLWSQEPRTIVFLGMMLGRQQFGDYHEVALRLFREATRHFPEEFIIHMELASWLESSKNRQFAEALEHASAAVTLSPESTSAWMVLGVSRDGTGDFEGAIQAFDRAIELDARSSDALLAKGQSQLRAGRVEASLATLTTALARTPDSDDLRYEHARARLFADDVAGAREELIQLGRTPRDLLIAAHAAEVLILLDDAKDALDVVRDAMRRTTGMTPSDVVLKLRGMLMGALVYGGRFEEALQEIRVTEQFLGGPRPDLDASQRIGEIARLADELPDFASGAREPASPLEASRVAFLLEQDGKTAFATEVWGDALRGETDEILADLPLARMYATRVALRAAAGQGEDAGNLDAGARARCRAAALRFANDDLAASLSEDALDPGAHARSEIELFFYAPWLQPVRDPARRTLLPPDEARAWEEFFARARVAMRRVRG